MVSRALVDPVSVGTGFQPNSVEKVLLLRAVLEAMVENEELEGQWVLKGGTALNLFFLDLPRL